MLGQVDPVSLLKSSNFANGGLLISSKAAKSAGLEYVGASKKPIGWCIGVTDHYAPKWPTHFFVVNEDLQLQIDPLDIDPKPEPLTYDIFEYRIFKGVKLHNALQEAIHLTSKSWQMLEEVQSQLHKSNTLLRNLS